MKRFFQKGIGAFQGRTAADRELTRWMPQRLLVPLYPQGAGLIAPGTLVKKYTRLGENGGFAPEKGVVQGYQEMNHPLLGKVLCAVMELNPDESGREHGRKNGKKMLSPADIIRIARVFNVSTDFLLGEVDIPARLNYDISELGLSVQAARNLYTHKVNPQVVNALLENPEFANTTNLISGYLDDELAKGFAAQNQLYATVAGMLRGQPDDVDDIKKLQTPVYQADLTAIQRSFMAAVQAVKKEVGNDLSANRELTSQAVKKIYAELTKGQKKLNRKITAEQIGEAVAQSVSHLTGIDTEAVKQMFLAMTGTVKNNEKSPDDQ